MWALIMTIYLGSGNLVENSSRASFSMATLDGFTTEQACRYAGAQQELALRNDFKINTSKKYTFVCVKKD